MALHFSRRDFLPAGLKADQIELVENTIRIRSHSAKTAAACPHCGTISRHVHSRYRRRPADLPAHGRAVELVLLVRRFRYRAMNCSAKIFAERFSPAVTRHMRGAPPVCEGWSGTLAWHWADVQHRHLLHGSSYRPARIPFCAAFEARRRLPAASSASSASMIGHGAKVSGTAR